MRINQYKFNILLFILIVIQLLVNNLSVIYLDLLGIVSIMVLLSREEHNWKQLILLTIIADLIGHWYLGTHLLAIVLICFVVDNMVKFYHLSGSLQKFVMLNLLYGIYSLFIIAIEFFTHSLHFNLYGYIFEIVVAIPILLFIFNGYLLSRTNDLIH